jgi:type III secretion protein Q
MDNQALYDEELETPVDDYEETELGFEQDEQQPEERLDPADADWQAHADDQAFADTRQQASSAIDPLDQLPLALTLRCGALNLTLGDLRRIGAGSVLEVSGVTPGHATLCHGERIVAEGELVDVDGRLGLQITRMASPA